MCINGFRNRGQTNGFLVLMMPCNYVEEHPNLDIIVSAKSIADVI